MVDKPWVQNKPEQRLSIAVDRLLRDTLAGLFYATAIHDADGGGRTDRQRARDANRGIKSGQLDWEVWQNIGRDLPLVRKVELKRGKNDTSPNQDVTITKLTDLGAPPITAWTLAEVIAGLQAAGFRFNGTLPTKLAYYEAQLAAWDREADAIMSGAVVKKRAAPKKAPPRFVMGKRGAKRMAKAGVRV